MTGTPSIPAGGASHFHAPIFDSIHHVQNGNDSFPVQELQGQVELRSTPTRQRHRDVDFIVTEMAET